MGGGRLGIRDIKLFNQALLLKLVWYIVAGTDRLWVHIMIAKYCPRGGFWAVRTTTGSSKLWKEIQGFKSFFKESTHWHICEGTNIAALNQRWYEGWTTKRITNNRDRNVKVSQLYDHTTQQWREEDIINLLGSDALEAICN